VSDRAGTQRHQPDQVVFVRAARPATTPGLGPEDAQFAVPIKDVKDAWRDVTKQLAEILSATDSSLTGKFKVTEFAVGVKVSGKGSLFGIVEAAAEASIVVKIIPA
jgi:hypothetical protein